MPFDQVIHADQDSAESVEEAATPAVVDHDGIRGLELTERSADRLGDFHEAAPESEPLFAVQLGIAEAAKLKLAQLPHHIAQTGHPRLPRDLEILTTRQRINFVEVR